MVFIYSFTFVTYCPDVTSVAAFFSFHCPGSHMLSESVGRRNNAKEKFNVFTSVPMFDLFTCDLSHHENLKNYVTCFVIRNM